MANDKTCAWCGGVVDLDHQPPEWAADTPPGYVAIDDETRQTYAHPAQGHDGDTWWCSDNCRKIIAGTHWPSPVGPATHEEMQRWIDADRDRLAASMAVMQELIRQREADLGHPLSEESLVDMAISAAKGHYAPGGA